MKRFVIITFSFILILSLLSVSLVQAFDTKAYHFGFKKGKEGKLASIAQEGFLEILKKNDAIFLGDTNKKELYLTFDNGYENGYTMKALDILKEKRCLQLFS